jgi:hypothetical protein
VLPADSKTPRKDLSEAKKKSDKRIVNLESEKDFPPLTRLPLVRQTGISGKKPKRASELKSKQLHDLVRSLPQGSSDLDSFATESSGPSPMMLSALVDQDTVYRFRLTGGPVFLATSGAGVTKGYETADPSGGGTWTAAEWNNLTPLFSEVRLVEFKIHLAFTGVYDSNAWQGTNPTFVWNTSLSTPGAAPTAISVVWDNASAKVLNPVVGNGKVYTMVVKPRSGLAWAAVGSADPGSYAGCPGSINYYGENFPNSISVGFYYQEGIYEFRSRI